MTKRATLSFPLLESAYSKRRSWLMMTRIAALLCTVEIIGGFFLLVGEISGGLSYPIWAFDLDRQIPDPSSPILFCKADKPAALNPETKVSTLKAIFTKKQPRESPNLTCG